MKSCKNSVYADCYRHANNLIGIVELRPASGEESVNWPFMFISESLGGVYVTAKNLGLFESPTSVETHNRRIHLLSLGREGIETSRSSHSELLAVHLGRVEHPLSAYNLSTLKQVYDQVVCSAEPFDI